MYRRQLEQRLGGPKRTRALVEVGQFLAFLPFFALVRLCGYGKVEHHVLDAPVSSASLLLPIVLSSVLAKPANYYVNMLSASRFGIQEADRRAYRGTAVFAFLWAYYWNHPFTHKISGIYGRADVVRQEHPFGFVTLLAGMGYYIAAGKIGSGKSSKGLDFF